MVMTAELDRVGYTLRSFFLSSYKAFQSRGLERSREKLDLSYLYYGKPMASKLGKKVTYKKLPTIESHNA